MMIARFYKIATHDPENDVQKALCSISTVIPAGNQAVLTVTWTERWANGVISKEEAGNNVPSGSYQLFLGYMEPCILTHQENITPGSNRAAPIFTSPIQAQK